jgi:hypothetical protein
VASLFIFFSKVKGLHPLLSIAPLRGLKNPPDFGQSTSSNNFVASLFYLYFKIQRASPFAIDCATSWLIKSFGFWTIYFVEQLRGFTLLSLFQNTKGFTLCCFISPLRGL